MISLLVVGACSGPEVSPVAPRDAGTHDTGSSIEVLDDGGLPDAGDVQDAAVAEVDAGDLVDAGDVADAGDPLDAGDPVDAGDGADAGAALVDAGTPVDPDPIIEIEGYGAATRGGWQEGHDVVRVSTLAGEGAGSLREAMNTNGAPRIVRFDVDGTIVLASAILVPSNMTIDGRGHDVTLSGRGLILVGSDDVIVTHLTIENVLPESDDGVRIGDPDGGASERVVLDHLTLRHTDGKGDSKFVDEAISVIFGSRDITIAWCRVEAWEKVILIGNGDAPQSVDGQITVTMHHTYTHDTGRRHPQARYGTFDFFNNFWDGWRMYGWYWEAPYRDAFGMLCQDSCRLLAENNLFARKPDAKDVLSRANDATVCQTGGAIDERGSVVAAGNTASLKFGVDCPRGTVVTRPYVARVDAATDALRLRLLAEAGNR